MFGLGFVKKSLIW